MKIKIEVPFHENWNKMTSTEKGRFCDTCKTKVVDFTKMNKQETTDYFVNSKTKICARIEYHKLGDR